MKLADRTVNMQEPPSHWPREKRVAYRDEARKILGAPWRASPAPTAARLAAKIGDYEQYCDEESLSETDDPIRSMLPDDYLEDYDHTMRLPPVLCATS